MVVQHGIFMMYDAILILRVRPTAESSQLRAPRKWQKLDKVTHHIWDPICDPVYVSATLTCHVTLLHMHLPNRQLAQSSKGDHCLPPSRRDVAL